MPDWTAVTRWPLTFLRRAPAALARDPFHRVRPPLYLPRAMSEPPPLAWPKPTGHSPAAGGNTRPHALLLNPFYAKCPHGSLGKHVLTPSLALTSIAAATPPGWTVQCWDENLLQGSPPTDPLPTVVGITVHLTFARRAYALAGFYRGLGAKVVLGGLHVLSCPEEAAAHADAIAIGDGVQLWPEILQDAAAGRLRARYEAGYSRSYDLDPEPRRDLLPLESFLTATSLIATRGCHNRCGFCYLSTAGLQVPYRPRDPRDIARQFEESGQPYGVFLDNNLGADRAYLRSLCAALEPLRKIWSLAVSLDVTDDPRLVRDMARSGCTGVFIGFESLNDANLAAARKKTPRASDYGRRVRLLQEHGIQVNGSFVVGFDGDTRDTFVAMAEWIEENRLECATFHILTPYPGTPLFRQYEREGRLLHRNWDLYDTAHVVFQPRNMSPEELHLGYDWLYRRIFSHGSIWRRRPRAWAAVPAYLGGAYLYKRANYLWPILIKHRLVRRVWHPLVELSRRRHLRWCGRLGRDGEAIGGGTDMGTQRSASLPTKEVPEAASIAALCGNP